ncbi:MAG: nucleotidyltransferase family protein, partial [Gammaproteobacteria bacterium]|nr:nucleotidyltransferase family protein [Gammaproteobacteria bacterium]
CMTNITGILLAAGQSTRFGSDKLLHPLGNGKTIAQQAAETIIQACPDSIAVINNNTASQLVEVLIDDGFNVIENHYAEDGMGSSIACGVKALSNSDACLIVLADMPFIKQETIESMLQLFKNTKCIISPKCKDQRGHPVLFSKHFFSELTQLNGEKGARDIIENNREYLMLIDVDDTGIIKDIDIKSDLDK